MKFGLLITFLFSSLNGMAQESNPIIGNWIINYEGSAVTQAERPVDVRQYRLRDDGFIVGVAIWVDGAGNPGFLQFTAKSDGIFYPEDDSSTLAEFQALGKRTGRTYAETIIDSNTIEWIDKNLEVVTASGTKIFTNNGKRMTLLVNYENQEGEMASYQLVYDRQ
jgi:hypothetical protein